MDHNTRAIVASNLVSAFYSAVERREPFFGEERGLGDKSTRGLDMRNPSISPDEVLKVYEMFFENLGTGR